MNLWQIISYRIAVVISNSAGKDFCILNFKHILHAA
jgi:hypothetical protein